MVTLSVKGVEPLLRKVKNAPKQIRFALVKSLNETAGTVQKAVVGQLLPERFTLRAKGRPWQNPGGPLGFNLRPFAKTSSVDPFVVLGSRADWLPLQEEGGTKTANNGKALAIPEEGTARPTHADIVARRNKPARLLARKGFFVVETKSGGRIILERRSKRRGGGSRVWYHFARAARINARLGFGPFAVGLAERTLPGSFERNLRVALATAR